MRTRKLLIPDYVQQFQCIGAACEDTCCRGWQVTVDKKTYMSYRKLHDLPLRNKVTAVMKRNRATKRDAHYAHIAMDTHGNCPLLTAEGLCGLQLKAGIEALPNTCIEYPRTVHRVNGILEQSMTISCPEVARLVLLNEEGLTFTEIEEPALLDVTIHRQKESLGRDQLLWPLRIASIRILQHRKATIEQRLIVLGLFLQKMDELSLSEQLKQVEQLASQYEARLTNAAFLAHLDELPQNLVFQLKMGRDLLTERINQFAISQQAFQDALYQMIKGLQLDETLADEQRIEIYQAAHRLYYEPFMAENGYMLENYLVNYVFTNLFPLNRKTYVDDYRLMITHFTLIRLMLIGIGRANEGLTKERVVHTMYSFSRSIEHSSAYKRHIEQLLGTIGCTTLGHLIALIQ